MENSLKAIIIGAGVVITMIVVTIGFMLMRSGQGVVQTTMGKVDRVSKEMNESEYTMYDGMEVSGSDVINLIRKYKEDYIGIYVKTKKNSGEWYIHNVTVSGTNEAEIIGESTKPISDAMDETKDDYVNPTGVFVGSVARDKNGRISALMFEQK